MGDARKNLKLNCSLASFSDGGLAVVIGESGALGSAFLKQLRVQNRFIHAVGISRSTMPALELTNEDSIADVARYVAGFDAPPRLIIDATGVLHDAGTMPEKSWRQLERQQLAKSFAVNAIGPALLMKHLLPSLPPSDKSVFATLSAKVGSIGDNQLGGWYGYRASKAALNQFVRTAAIELRRQKPEAICVALHPGTVDSKLSAPFAKSGLKVRSPLEAAGLLLEVIDQLTPADSGGFYDYMGKALPW